MVYSQLFFSKIIVFFLALDSDVLEYYNFRLTNLKDRLPDAEFKKAGRENLNQLQQSCVELEKKLLSLKKTIESKPFKNDSTDSNYSFWMDVGTNNPRRYVESVTRTINQELDLIEGIQNKIAELHLPILQFASHSKLPPEIVDNNPKSIQDAIIKLSGSALPLLNSVENGIQSRSALEAEETQSKFAPSVMPSASEARVLANQLGSVMVFAVQTQEADKVKTLNRFVEADLKKLTKADYREWAILPVEQHRVLSADPMVRIAHSL